MNLPKHSPTPWKLIDVMGHVSIHSHPIQILAYHEPVPQSRVNAAHIVRCVNSHDDLLAACRRMESIVRNASIKTTDVGIGSDLAYEASLAKEAIAKAEADHA